MDGSSIYGLLGKQYVGWCAVWYVAAPHKSSVVFSFQAWSRRSVVRVLSSGEVKCVLHAKRNCACGKPNRFFSVWSLEESSHSRRGTVKLSVPYVVHFVLEFFTLQKKISVMIWRLNFVSGSSNDTVRNKLSGSWRLPTENYVLPYTRLNMLICERLFQKMLF